MLPPMHPAPPDRMTANHDVSMEKLILRNCNVDRKLTNGLGIFASFRQTQSIPGLWYVR